MRRTKGAGLAGAGLVWLVLLTGGIPLRAESPPATSFWSALSALGYDAAGGEGARFALGQQRWEALLSWVRSVHGQVEMDPEVAQLFQQSQQRLLTLDAGGLYDILPYRDPGSSGRGIGLEGQFRDRKYLFTTADPDLETWLAAGPDARPVPWGPAEYFGDLGLRALLVSDEATERFALSAEAQLHTGRFPSGLLARAAAEVLETAGTCAAGGDEARAERQLADTLARDLPHLVDVVTRFVEFEDAVERVGEDGAIHWRLSVRVRHRSLGRVYPALDRMLRRVERMLQSEMQLRNAEGQDLLTAVFERKTGRLVLCFCTRGTILRPLGAEDAPASAGFDLLQTDPQLFTAIANLELSMMGVRLEIKPIEVDLFYRYHPGGMELTAGLQRQPEHVETRGFALGFVPVWLIDLMIPSNLDQLAGDFIHTLATGRDGQGARFRVGPVPSADPAYRMRLDAEAAVLSNGLLRFSFNMMRRVGGPSTHLSRDLQTLALELLETLEEDYRAWSSAQPGYSQSPR